MKSTNRQTVEKNYRAFGREVFGAIRRHQERLTNHLHPANSLRFTLGRDPFRQVAPQHKIGAG